MAGRVHGASTSASCYHVVFPGALKEVQKPCDGSRLSDEGEKQGSILIRTTACVCFACVLPHASTNQLSM